MCSALISWKEKWTCRQDGSCGMLSRALSRVTGDLDPVVSHELLLQVILSALLTS